MLFALASMLLSAEEIFFIVTFYNLSVPMTGQSTHRERHQFCVRNCFLILSEKTRCQRELGIGFGWAEGW